MKKLLVLAVVLASLSGGLVAPVFAETDDNPSGDDIVATPSPGSTKSPTPAPSATPKPGGDSLKDKTEAAREAARNRVRQKIQDQQEATKDKLSNARKEICDARESLINAKIDRAAENGQLRLERISSIRQNLEQFVERRGLSIPNYETLLANADAAYIDASAEVEAVKALVFECDNETSTNGIGAEVSKIVSSRNSAVRAYRDTVKALAQSIKAVVTEQADATDGGTQ